MADLMEGVYTYEELAKKYDDFCVPLIKIIKNGKDLVAGMQLTVVQIQVSLSLEAAGMAVFKLAGLYDEERHSFDRAVKDAFALGSVFEIELGYVSCSTTVFKGYVAMTGAEFSDAPYFNVTMMDVRRLMMVSGNQCMLHEVKNYSDAFQAVMKKYSRLCSLEIDATDDKLEDPVSQVQNDYHFVTQELIRSGRADREFFALGGKVYFRKPRKVRQPVMSLRYGRELLAFCIEEEYQDLKVEVVGYDDQAQNAVRASVMIPRNSTQKKLLSSTQTLTLTDPAVDTPEKAAVKAEKLADEKGWGVQSGQGITIGFPELAPGRYVRIEALEEDYGNHDYYIRSVSHQISAGSFRTRFETGGWL